MNRQTRVSLIISAAALLGTSLVAAQDDPQYTPSSNPYQAEFAYRIDGELRPAVEIDRVRWRSLKVSPKNADDVRSGDTVTTFIELDFENTGGDAATVVVVVLFEDEQGNSLDRVECEPEKVRGGEARSARQKVKLQGDVLLATAKLYLFYEVQR